MVARSRHHFAVMRFRAHAGPDGATAQPRRRQGGRPSIRGRNRFWCAAIFASSLPLALVTSPALASSSAPNGGQSPNAGLTAVHAMPGTSALSLYQNKNLFIRKLNTGTVDGPLQDTPGTYSYSVRKRGSSSSSTPLAVITGVVLKAGDNATVLAGFTTAGLRKMWLGIIRHRAFRQARHASSSATSR